MPSTYLSSKDTLAAIQAQPGYFLTISASTNPPKASVRSHIQHREVSAESVAANGSSRSQEGLQKRYDIDSIDAAHFFEAMSPTQAVALHSTIRDLILTTIQ
ncbi:uncharacterized protein PHALS_02246 [Plasmopara halstedii]|uniref:Uncharacterized protein n=1 Tax=Plasmopara halstedii TaxID=4781 RepID=A0A0P1AWS3_PLAHL|nr:uncharacterized protein PHALS_02246 [Plasmopara halstedii]CEG45913.1 hypothetical protein PHALS_02246 [Plasmopara halstedii]|eukprot:XP_024582282.1 hypothetical protein PHALS_02246 [Plasmopara halstedii]